MGASEGVGLICVVPKKRGDQGEMVIFFVSVSYVCRVYLCMFCCGGFNDSVFLPDVAWGKFLHDWHGMTSVHFSIR